MKRNLSSSDCVPSPKRPSLLPLPTGKHEVFLSFRGPDVRRTFADCLYKFLDHSKIRTFLDDEELRKGEKIAPSLVEAIHESKVYIPILSQDYASSKWCLEELSLMVKSLNQNQGHILLPIFYFVEPRDVRRQEGSYSEAFRRHSQEYDAETITEWKEALQVVGEMKGWHVTESDGQGDVIEKVFSEVWSHLMANYAIVTDELIGIDSHVKEVLDLLDLDSKGLKVVGIHGIGGIGKTTLSKAVYNEVSSWFDRCCFLEDVRETLLKADGVVTLQNKVISNILRHDNHVKDVSEGIHLIKDKVCKYKVLIVLDDVDRRFEFDKVFGKLQDFSIESRFILTTRDKRVLEFFEECRLFEAKEMSDIDSCQLLRKHAFQMDDPQEGSDTLCEEFVKLAAGLPLALKVIGSLLFRKDIRIWEEKLEELKESPFTGVHEILKISYNDLTPTEKEIFLDIACFFIGETKECPFYMWNECKFYPESGISNLILKSLIKINKRSEFWMHDHIRDLGRAIVYEENIRQPWKRSRIWSNEDALDMLENGKGSAAVQVLRINMEDRGNLELTEKDFNKLSGIRFLDVWGGGLTGDFSKMLPNIQWLQLGSCHSIPTDINLKKLVILSLEHSNVWDYWRGWKRIKESKKLKVVNLRWCDDLVKAPDLSFSGSLEVINLDVCCDMGGELHISNFKKLKLLRLSGSKITELKGDIQMLQDLKEIDASRSKLTKLPTGIGKLGSLEILHLVSCLVEVPALPTSLKQLTLSSPRVPNLLELKDLEVLCFQNCYNGPQIPGDIGLQLPKLKKLNVDSCATSSSNGMGVSATQLPSSLNSLVVRSCQKLERLPNLANLSNLTELRLVLVVVHEISGLGELRMLETLEISRAPHLENLDGLENLVLLQRLTLDRCDAVEKLPSLSSLVKLHTLKIRRCKDLFEIQGSQSLDAKLSNLSALKNLKKLTIRDGAQLAKLEELDRLESLECLDMEGCMSIEKLPPNMFNLKNLWSLSIVECMSWTFTEDCGLEGLNSLKKLYISGCRSIIRLPNLCGLPNLIDLDIRECTELTDVMGLRRLESLRRLNLTDCASIVRLPNLSDLKNLKVLNIGGCKQLTEIRGLESLETLQALAMSNCKSINKLPDLSCLEYLRYLDVRECTQLTEVMGVESWESLELLAMSNCKSISNFSDLSGLKNLKHLDIRGCSQLTEIIGLHKFKSLQVLGLHNYTAVSILGDPFRDLHWKYLALATLK
ncbi:unnamed protein product [Linum tenue]|uniref:TIR domain-containing protein n=1 Tax=Linum tenue TaxID=586396 RepID=A0AAV0M9X7_9ROSI|nr:unnamed protein product [Linum tenue]